MTMDEELVESLAQMVTNINQTFGQVKFSHEQLEQFKKATTFAEQASMQFKAVMSPLAIAASQWQTSFSEVLAPVATKFAKATIDLPWTSIAENMMRMLEGAQRSQRDLAEFIVLLTKLGWTPALEVSVTDISFWVHLYRRDGLEAVREPLGAFLTKVYDEGLMNRMLERWAVSPHLAERMPILRQVIEGHIAGYYSLTVPVIMAQTEGLIADINGHQGWLRQEQYKRYLQKAISKDKQLAGLVWSFVTDYLLQSFVHGTHPIPELSRNAILHGMDIAYASEQNSIKAILLFDYLQEQSIAEETADDDIEQYLA